MKLAKCACGLRLGLRYRQRPNTNKQLADVTSSKKISLFIFSDRTRRDVSLNGFVCVTHTHTHTHTSQRPPPPTPVGEGRHSQPQTTAQPNKSPPLSFVQHMSVDACVSERWSVCCMQIKRETLHTRTPSKSSSDPCGPGYGWGSLDVRGCLGRRSSMLPTFQPAGHGRGQGKVMHAKGEQRGLSTQHRF